MVEKQLYHKKECKSTNSWILGVMGGAGRLDNLTELNSMKQAIYTICVNGGLSLQQSMEGYRVGVQMVKELEDSELFNAGLGCNLNLLGEVECEASVVDGQNKSFAALSTLNDVRNPILGADLLLSQQFILPPLILRPPLILSGSGANEFCKSNKLGKLEEITQTKVNKWKELVSIVNGEGEERDNLCSNLENTGDTVGVICIDSNKNTSAATSTGGPWLKPSGRIGPCAIPGASIYAQNSGDISAGNAITSCFSGNGEFIIQNMLAREFANFTVNKNEESLKYLDFFEYVDAQTREGILEPTFGYIALSIDGDKTQKIYYGHSTKNMVFGYYASGMKQPVVRSSNLSHGRKYKCKTLYFN